MYSEGLGVNQDYKTAVKWYALAAEQGLANAQYNLGRMYSLGQGVNQDDKQAAEWVTRAAEQGHAEAQLVLGECILKDKVLAKIMLPRICG